jgi:predicted kinase
MPAPAVPLLLIISGPPCTGKTTLGRQLACDLGLPFIHKDGFKELLFDSLGWSDREWSKRVGGASYRLMFYFAEALLKARCSFALEANFYPEFHTGLFTALQQKFPYYPLQVNCQANPEIILERFQARASTSERHPGHVDDSTVSELAAALSHNRHLPLPLGGEVWVVDTTDFDQLDYPALLRAVKAAARQVLQRPHDQRPESSDPLPDGDRRQP